MIRNLAEDHTIKSIKSRVMATLVHILKSQNTQQIVLIAILQLITYFSSVSVLFASSPLSPTKSNYIYQVFILSQIDDTTSIDEEMVVIIYLAIMSMATILLLFSCAKLPLKQAVSAYGHFQKGLRIMAVPIFYYTLENIYELCTDTSISTTMFIMKAVASVETIGLIIFTLIFTYFEIRPLRSGNLLWNYDNRKQFAFLALTLASAWVNQVDGLSITYLLVNIVVHLAVYDMKEPCMNTKMAIFMGCKHTLVISTQLSLFLGLIFDNGKLALILICISFGVNICYSLLKFYTAKQLSEQISGCKIQNCKQLYNFYVGFWSKNKNKKETVQKINTHYLICSSQDCIFANKNDDMARITDEQVQQKITSFLKNNKAISPQNQLMYQLWKIQLNQTITISHRFRQFSVPHRFVVNYVLGPEVIENKKDSVNGDNLNGIASNSLNSRWKFYKQLSDSVNIFQRLAETMSKPLPELNEIIQIVIEVYYVTEELSKLFQEMVKLKQINYTCVELYMKFIQCFLDYSKLPNDITERFKRMKMLNDSDSIQQNSMPCFVVQSQTKQIQKVNAQALKFLKTQRYEIKDKIFSNLIIPSINVKQLEQLQNKNNKQQYLPVFFKVKSANSNTLLCRNVKTKTMQINNKTYYQITVCKRNTSHNVIQMLIDEDQKIVACSEQSISLIYRNSREEKPMEQVFAQKIANILQDVTMTKIGRIQFEGSCLTSGHLVQKFCPYPKMRLLSLNLVRKINTNRNNKRVANARLTRVYQHEEQFNFFYREDNNQRLMLEGSQKKVDNNCIILSTTLQMHRFNQKINLMIDKIVNPSTQDYSTGIKVYRLWNEDLYNIDLQDKQKYQQQFQGVAAIHNQKGYKLKLNQNCMLIFLVLMGFLISSACIFLYVEVDGYLYDINTEQIKYLKIQQFNLNFYRMMGCMRDQSNGLYAYLNRTSAADILDSYQQLQKLDMSQFYRYDKKYTVVYDNLTYYGTLTQLVEVCLTHVYEYMQGSNATIIQKVHSYTMTYLNPIIDEQKDSIITGISQKLEMIKFRGSVCFGIIVTGGVIYIVLFLLITKKFKENIDVFLEPMLMVSEPEIRRVAEECEKFSNVITSLYKNYQVDLTLLCTKQQKSKKRLRPKKTNFGLSSIVTQVIFASCLLIFLTILSLAQLITIRSDIDLNTSTFTKGIAVMQSYTEIIWLSNQISHTGYINRTKLASLAQKMTLIQNTKSGTQFYSDLTTMIQIVYFSSSCAYLVEKQIIDSDWCGDTLIGFEMENPFSLTLDSYLRRLQLNLITNITQTYASTGVYSDPFKSLYQYFSTQIIVETEEKVQETRTTFLILSIIVIGISAVFLWAILLYFCYYKTRLVIINKGLAVLSGEQTKEKEQKDKANSKRHKTAVVFKEPDESQHALQADEPEKDEKDIQQ